MTERRPAPVVFADLLNGAMLDESLDHAHLSIRWGMEARFIAGDNGEISDSK